MQLLIRVIHRDSITVQTHEMLRTRTRRGHNIETVRRHAAAIDFNSLFISLCVMERKKKNPISLDLTAEARSFYLRNGSNYPFARLNNLVEGL